MRIKYGINFDDATFTATLMNENATFQNGNLRIPGAQDYFRNHTVVREYMRGTHICGKIWR